ncbi:site-specific recombinase XerD [Litorivivens lipolytica]|uniref:Site-specific recombinase XerD n=1 Tax=Litorivivens lipolytica TaxID=1524264 RepID=A0A7W4W7P3_9GAMM|nr:tyrosine-type recombinase/integrase [Litorivivens lipolytica]MBB3048925.1 site-specific recombinase XerD [Litorivivens lipolytica]
MADKVLSGELLDLSDVSSQLVPQTPGPEYANPALLYLSSLTSASSRRAMASALKNIAIILGCTSIEDCPWEKIERQHVFLVKAAMSKAGKTPNGINMYLSAIRGVAREAHYAKRIDKDHYDAIASVKSETGSRLAVGRSLPLTEVNALLKSCWDEGTAAGARDALMMLLLYACGLRRSELVSVEKRDLNLAEGWVRIIGKGNKQRAVPIEIPIVIDAARHYIEEWRGNHEGPLFTRILKNGTIKDTALSDQAVYYILDKRRGLAGLGELSPHDMRRTFITTLLDANINLKTVADLAGHKSVNTTARYDRGGEKRMREAVGRLPSPTTPRVN